MLVGHSNYSPEILTVSQAWFMDVVDSTYGGGIWVAVMMMGLNVSQEPFYRMNTYKS